ncbi:MAG: hypothetical protein IPK33_11905 [Gemmatimonadetes bacterium]|nr:hypothetical protein [Gemmatimonadota bacterium]
MIRLQLTQDVMRPLQQTTTRMRLQVPDALEIPHGATILWRYMSHTKFQDLVQRRALYFANASRLSDQYEVSIPQSTIRKERRDLERAGLSSDEVDQRLRRFLWVRNPDKDLTLLSCWTTRRSESYAFWKIYVGKDTLGVAVRTTVARLKRALSLGADPIPEDFFMGRVRYRTFLSDSELTRYHVICTKKPFYDFESELRVFLLHYSAAGARNAPYDVSQGRHVNVALDELVTRVVVSPFTQPAYRSEVATLLREAQLGSDVVTSDILDQ